MGRKPVTETHAGIEAALAALRRGGVIAYPTETFYALGADPRKRSALKRLRRLKRRRASKPLLLVAASRRQALSLVRRPYPSRLLALGRRFWPGALTLVLPPLDPSMARALGRAGGVAVRVTNHPLARRLIRRYGHPITGTSANPAQGAPARDAAQARAALGAGLDEVLEGGRRGCRRPSTLVDLTCAPPLVLRAGAIPLPPLKKILPDLRVKAGRVALSARARRHP